MRRFLLIAIPFGWLLAFFLVPFFIVVKISLSTRPSRAGSVVRPNPPPP